MAKFGINDIVNVKSMASGADRVSEYKEIWLSPYEVKPSESNFYSQEKIEELADSFLAVGQQQPSVLTRIDGEFIIVSGHRRNLANIYNVERGYEKYRKVKYLYKDMSPAMMELSLLMGNACNRELTAWEKTRQAQRLKEALIKARDEDGLEIRGKLRDVIADIMNESSTNIARMDSISKNAVPEIKEAFQKGVIGISAAYEAAKLPYEEQVMLAEKAAKEGGVSSKEIMGKTVKSGSKHDGNVNLSEKVSESDTKLQSSYAQNTDKKQGNTGNGAESENGITRRKAIEKTVQEQIAEIYSSSLQEWAKKNTGAATKASEEAIHKVSESDTPQKDWTSIEWTVFTARMIMKRADCVSTEDFRLLYDIMTRCLGA